MFRCTVCRRLTNERSLAWTITQYRDSKYFATYRICLPFDGCIADFEPIEPEEDDEFFVRRWGNIGITFANRKLNYQGLLDLVKLAEKPDKNKTR